ncbi:SDC1 [Candida margitis]|uniref:SDC1 n=1 Tax=Candida margitis TaxID=1775924 RepID=UPI0022262AED|nr:SDC1 [Candida margitis]KAI5967897.1 SDC1 [Candida margitis]
MNIADIVQEKEDTPVANGVSTREESTEPQVKQELSPQSEPRIKAEPNGTPRGTTPTPQLQSKQVKQESISCDSNLPPLHEIVGGSSIRRYLNKHLTQHLLDGLKEVGQVKPEDPLRHLGEFLIARSDKEKESNTEES